MKRIAWIIIVIADVGLLAWGAMAALAPAHLIGPGGAPILTAGYENFTGHSWSALANTAPMSTEFMTVLFRLYGTFNVAVGLLAAAIAATAFRRGESWAWWALLFGNTIAYGAAMTYDRIVSAIGPFEVLEYVAIAGVYAALAVTAPFLKTAAIMQHDSTRKAGMRRLMILFYLPFIGGGLPPLAIAQQPVTRPPIIDVHLHAMGVEALRSFGPNPVTRAVPPGSVDEHVRRTLAEMQKYNVVLGIMGGSDAPVCRDNCGEEVARFRCISSICLCCHGVSAAARGAGNAS